MIILSLKICIILFPSCDKSCIPLLSLFESIILMVSINALSQNYPGIFKLNDVKKLIYLVSYMVCCKQKTAKNGWLLSRHQCKIYANKKQQKMVGYFHDTNVKFIYKCWLWLRTGTFERSAFWFFFVFVSLVNHFR